MIRSCGSSSCRKGCVCCSLVRRCSQHERAPDALCRKQMDVSELDGKKCELGVTGGKQTARSAIKLGDGRVVCMQPRASSSQYLSSFVCNTEKRWVIGKPFAREINIVQRFDFGSKADECPKINVPVPMHVLEQQKTRSCAAVGGTSKITATGASSKLEKAKTPKKLAKEKKKSKREKKTTKEKKKKTKAK